MPLLLTGAGKQAAAGGGGGVSVNATGTYGYKGTLGTTYSYTGLTIAAGSNRALVVAVVWDVTGASPSGLSMNWNGQSLSRIVGENLSQPDPYCELWGVVAPATGNQTLAMSWTGNARAFVVGMCFGNVDQSTPFPNTAHAGAVATVTVTSAVGNKVMNVAIPSAISGITGTTIFSDAVSSSFNNAFANYMDGASPNVVIGQSNTSAAACATDIKAV